MLKRHLSQELSDKRGLPSEPSKITVTKGWSTRKNLNPRYLERNHPLSGAL